MQNRDEVIAAIQASWSRETSATPDEWTPANAAKGQCDVSSFVAWEYLGGDLVEGEVHIDDEFREHHYWNRIDGVDLDLTNAQFDGHAHITETRTLTAAFLAENRPEMRQELGDRIDVLRRGVEDRLGRSS